MLKNIFSIYTLLVCFVCVMIFTVSISMMGNAVIVIKFPQYDRAFYNSDTPSWDALETNETYLQYKQDKIPDHEGPRLQRDRQAWEDLSRMTPDQLTEKRLAEKETLIRKIHLRAEKEIVHLLPLLLTSLLIFIIHWGLYRRQRRSER